MKIRFPPWLVAPAKAGAQSEHVSRPTGGISLFVLDTGLRRYDELLNGMGFPRTAVGFRWHDEK